MSSRAHGTTLAAVVLVGVLLATSLVVGEQRLLAGSADVSRSAVEQADRLLPKSWATVPLVSTKVAAFYGVSDRSVRPAALESAAEATRRAPNDPRTWIRRGNLEAVWGSERAAASAFANAVRLDPWSVPALRGAARSAAATGRQEEVARLCRRAALVSLRGKCADQPMASWR